MIRILFYEDNKNYREALEEAFSISEKVCISKSFAHADRIVKQVKEYHPDVILLDIEMPGISGLDALKVLGEAQVDCKVMIQTQFEDEHRLFIALCRGAWGYALKSDSFDRIETAIVDVHAGGGYFSPSIAGKVTRLFQNENFQQEPEYISLTSREKEVLGLLVKGLKYKEIATALHLSYEGVHSHIKKIYQKLHVTSRSEAIIKTLENKII